MRKLVEWLNRRSAAIASAPDPVPGWLMQWAYAIGALWLLYERYPQGALTLIVGSSIIRVNRTIEADRRKGKYNAPD